jgi:hypothetical protein
MASRDGILRWAPRVLAIAYIAFLSLFALDVFGEGRGPAATLAALAMHLLPSIALAAALALAWRREWIGTLLFAAAGAAYVWWALTRDMPPLATRLLWCATIAGPAFLLAALFWGSWRLRRGLRTLGNATTPRADRPRV